MAIPIYVVCKAQGNTIDGIGCEVPRQEGKKVLGENICCRYEKLGEIFHYYFKIQTDTLYIGDESLHFDDRNIEVQINVRSHEGRKTPKLEYLFKENLQVQDSKKFSLGELAKLDYGIKVLNYKQNGTKEKKISLDYLRSNLFNMSEFKSVPTTADLDEELHKYITKAKKENSDIYIFGDLYSFNSKGIDDREERIRLLKEYGPEGLHDIHMNQGSSEKKEWIENSGVYQDGGVLINFQSKEENSWTAIFLKFESQHVETHNETGRYL